MSNYDDCRSVWCPPASAGRGGDRCHPVNPCGNCSSCKPYYSHAENAFNINNMGHISLSDANRSIIHLESIEVAVPTAHLLQKAKAVLPERDFPETSRQLLTARFMEGLDAKKMTYAVAALGESLSRKLPEHENIKGRIVALLRPFVLSVLGAGKSGDSSTNYHAVAFSLTGDEVTELNNEADHSKAAQREGKKVVQEDIDLSHGGIHTAHSPPTFYQILLTAAYSHRDRVFNFGYCYIHRKDHTVSEFLGDHHNRAKRLAAMKIECITPLAQVLRAMSFSRNAVTLVRNDDNYKSQAAHLL